MSFLEVVQATTAPTIDGVIEAAWDDANAVTTAKQVQGTAAVATVRTLWSGGTLYVLAVVPDPVVDVSGSDPWVQDSVELYVDPGNVKNGSYRYDDSQIRISAANAVSFGTGDEAFQRARVQSATELIEGGYLVEAAITIGDAGGLGTFQGLDFQVNDAAGGARSGISNWADPSGAGYQSTARWGVGEFVGQAGPVNLVSPTVSGEPRIGQVLTATPGEWNLDGLAFSYRWLRDGEPIVGATTPSYRVKGVDRGHALTVEVTATADGFEPVVVASAPLAVPKPGKG